MALSEKTEIGKIEVSGPFKMLSVRTDTVIERDGVEISRSYHRHCVCPDADLTGEDSEVVAVANAVHTQEIKDAYLVHITPAE